MAMWCYCNLMKKGLPPSQWEHHDIRDWAMNLIQEEHLRLLTLSRVWQLLESTDKQVLFKVHHGASTMENIAEITWNYFEVTLERMAQNYDPLGRILNIKDPMVLLSKYKTRFCNLKHFLYENRVSTGLKKKNNDATQIQKNRTTQSVPKWIRRLASSYDLNGVIAVLKALHRDFMTACTVANVEVKPVALNQIWSGCKAPQPAPPPSSPATSKAAAKFLGGGVITKAVESSTSKPIMSR